MEIWWIGSFPQNLAWIRAAIFENRCPWALSLGLWCLTTCPDIQLSFILNWHVAEVKYLVYQGASLFIFICSCTIKTHKKDLELYKVKGTPYTCLQLPPTSTFHSAFPYGQLFSNYLDMKLGHWPNFQKFHIYIFLPQCGKFGLISALYAAVSEIWSHFQNYHSWAWDLPIGQSARTCTYTP